VPSSSERRYRVQAYWREGAGAPERIGQQLAAFLAALEWADARLGGFRFETADGEERAADTSEACGRAARESAYRWRLGHEDKVCYQPRFFSDRADLVVTAGVEPLPLASLFAPNRLELLLAAELGSRDVLEKALRATAIFRADFGHAGTVRFPSPAEPLLSDGTPVAGWLTYLSAAHAPSPSWPPTASTLPVAELGTLVVAHPDVFADDNEDHREAVGAVQRALQGV
jgi:hypothetical protein